MKNTVVRFLLPMALASSITAAGQPKPPPDMSLRHELDIGYSLLYQEASGIPKMDWLLSLKNKSAEMNSATEALMRYYKDLASELEKLSKAHPTIHLDTKTMPDIEAEARKSMGVDQAKDFAPLVGKTGNALEREALITFRSALDEQRHLVGAMLDKESKTPLRHFLELTRTQLDDHYSQISLLLERRYFIR